MDDPGHERPAGADHHIYLHGHDHPRIAADAFIIGQAIAYAFSNDRTLAIIYVAVLLAVATWMNLRGIRLVGAAEKIINTLVVAFPIAVGAAALFRHGNPAHLSSGVSGSPVSALIFGIFLYTGFEWVTTNSEEVVKPKIIPKTMLVAIGALALSQGLFAVAIGLTLDHGQRATAYPSCWSRRQRSVTRACS